MAQKKFLKVVEEVGEIKATLEFMTKQITDVKEQQSHFLDLVKKVQMPPILSEEEDRENSATRVSSG